MPRVAKSGLIRAALAAAVVVASATLLAACDDPVKQAKIAASVRIQVEAMLDRMEQRAEVPGLQRRHVTVEADGERGGYLVQIYDLKVGDAALGFQSFSQLTFNLAPRDEGHFTAQGFKFTPKPVTDAPDSAPGMLVEQLKASVSTIEVAE